MRKSEPGHGAIAKVVRGQGATQEEIYQLLREAYTAGRLDSWQREARGALASINTWPKGARSDLALTGQPWTRADLLAVANRDRLLRAVADSAATGARIAEARRRREREAYDRRRCVNGR